MPIYIVKQVTKLGVNGQPMYLPDLPDGTDRVCSPGTDGWYVVKTTKPLATGGKGEVREVIQSAISKDAALGILKATEITDKWALRGAK